MHPSAILATKRWRTRRAKLVKWYREQGCAICGIKDGIFNLHHKDKSTKTNSPLAFLQHISLNNFFNEISKCILVCTLCHANIHNSDTNVSDIPTIILPADFFEQ